MKDEYKDVFTPCLQKDDLNNTLVNIAFQCSALLSNLKIANLLILKRRLNSFEKRELMIAKANIFELFFDENICVYYVYKKKNIKHLLTNNEVMDFLKSYGYPENLELSLLLLRRRYLSYKVGESGFPHEIGIFLGYPLDDVLMFIQKEGRDQIFCGYWKVYTKPNYKKRLFMYYDLSKYLAVRLIKNGGRLCKISDSFRWEYRILKEEVS